MAEPAPKQADAVADFIPSGPDPVMRPVEITRGIDWTTLGGLIGAHVLLGIALAVGGDLAAFLDVAAFFIVIGGTIMVTLTSFRWEEIRISWPTLKNVFFKSDQNLTSLARTLVDMSILVRRRGTLALGDHERLWRNNTLLYPYITMVIDGYTPHEIERMAAQELDTALDQYRKAASVLRRAAETAPGMGLIGTLIGLVQMLGNLQSPEVLGPSMAIALLTTLYGAMLANVVLTPLATKIERNANLEATQRQIILTAATALSVIDNPRRVEMAINSYLPPEDRLSYLTKGFK